MIKKYAIYITISVILLTTFFASVTNAALMPFGGRVTAIVPCNSGLLVWVLTPLTGVLPFMWFTGNLPFAHYVPPHPGQALLGMASSATVPCVVGPVVVGAGFPIIYHGGSI